MKKITSILLVLVLLLSLTACGQKYTDIIRAQEEGTAVDINDPVYAEIADMVTPIAKFVEYNHILRNTIDYDNVGAEDFWNIVAIVVSSYDNIDSYATTDAAGVYHMKWDTMLEFAKAFLYKSWFRHNTPSYKDSYSASADPGSGVIDLIPLGVDNFDGSLTYIEEASLGSGYKYVLGIDLTNRDPIPTVHHYEVYIADWGEYIGSFNGTDKGNHVMPYAVIGYRFVGTDEPQN